MSRDKLTRKFSRYKYARRRMNGRIMPDWHILLVCRRHGHLHQYKVGCPRCTRRLMYRPYRPASAHRRGDRRGQSKPA